MRVRMRDGIVSDDVQCFPEGGADERLARTHELEFARGGDYPGKPVQQRHVKVFSCSGMAEYMRAHDALQVADGCGLDLQFPWGRGHAYGTRVQVTYITMPIGVPLVSAREKAVVQKAASVLKGLIAKGAYAVPAEIRQPACNQMHTRLRVFRIQL